MSKQSWAISPKIREVDSLLQRHSQLRARVRETHPEVCFWGLAQRPMQYSKKTREGFQERLEILEEAWGPATDVIAEAFLQYGGFEAQRDDVVDAVVAAVCASRIEQCLTLPGEPETDATGLPMAIVYWPATAS